MDEENRPSSMEQCINDIAECPICNDVLKDNRCLPCLHMFCLKCLESYRKGKPKGKPLPCPVCRREFPIPKSVAELPRNFFIDKLLDAQNIKKQDALSRPCEICSEDSSENPKLRTTSIHIRECISVARATRFCCECRQHMCQSCEKQHKKIKTTACHTIIDSTSVTNSQEIAPRTTYCITHKTKEAEVYCRDCKIVICWQCKALSHSSHYSLDVSNATKDLAAKLEEHFEKLTDLLQAKQADIRKLKEQKKLYTDAIDVESDNIFMEQRKLCRNITEKADKLKKALAAATMGHLNAFDQHLRILDTDADELNKHKVYIEQMIHLGNVSDLCKYTDALILKTARLAEENTFRIDVPPVVHLSDADIQDLLTGKRTDIDLQFCNMVRADISNDSQMCLRDNLPPINESRGSLEDQGNADNSRPHDDQPTSSLSTGSFEDEDPSRHNDLSLGLIRTMTTEANRTVCGITVFDSMLYVIAQDSKNISVYSVPNLELIRILTVDGLFNPNDIVSCKLNNVLYIIDWGESRIFRVRVRAGMEQMNWSTGKDMGCLSVTIEHTILMAGYVSNRIKEYTSDGVLVRSIDLGEHMKPWHAIRLGASNPHYLICQGDQFSKFHRVCLIDLNGKVITTFGGVPGSDAEHMCGPYHLAVDKSGCIYVNDCNNSRILLLSSKLKLIKEIIPSSAHILGRARRMHLDEDAGRLYVIDNAKTADETKYGKILVFGNS